MISTDTTAIYRKAETDTAEDLIDQAQLEREAEARGFNAGLELAACLVRLNGDKPLAALIRRQRKGII